jgi:hypothetical protein
VADKKYQRIREAVSVEMERQKLTTYQLWKLVEKSMSKPTVYDFIAGEKNITSDKLDDILKALKLRICRDR